MNWVTFIALIAKEGLPTALDLYDRWVARKGTAPTAEEIEGLRALAAKTSKSQMLEALARAGIDPGSEQGKKFLGLV